MLTNILFSILIPGVPVLAIGISLLVLIRKRISRSAPVIAAAASIAVLAGTISIVARAAGVNVSAFWPGLFIVCAFFGAISVQPVPWETASVLRGLAVACGATAMVSAFTSDLMVTVVALFAAGVLVFLPAGPLAIKNHSGHEDRSSEHGV